MSRPTRDIQSGTDVRVPLSKSMAAALDTLVAATGEAKRSHLRRAVAQYLASLDLVDVQEVPATATTLTTPKEYQL